MSLLVKGTTKLSRLEIDADKDWGGYGITNLKQVAAGMGKGDIIYQDVGLVALLNKLSPTYGVGTSFLHVKSLGGGVFVPEWADIQSIVAYITAGLNRVVQMPALDILVPAIAKIVAENHSGGGYSTPRLIAVPVPGVGRTAAEDHSGGGFTIPRALSIAAPELGDDATLLYERYQTGEDAALNVYGSNWEAQTFTPAATHDATRINLKLARYGSPGTVTVGIRATSGGLPSGADLVSTIFDGNALATSAPWKLIVITAQSLLAGTKYGIVVRATGGDVNNYLVWRADVTSPTYTGGARCYSSDIGVTWAEDTSKDFIFEEGVGQV